MDAILESDSDNDVEDFFGVVDPLGILPFSKIIEQVPHRELTKEELAEQRERDLRLEKEGF